MRVKNSIKNIYIGVLTQIIITVLGFVSRKVFLDSLGSEYLGVNGLISSILSMLSLVEGGIGLSIIYNMYKPIADDDKPKIIGLVQLYKKLYCILSLVVLVLSIVIYLFLSDFLKGNGDVKFIGVVYFIFVAKNIVSYLNAHKWSLINADQKGYVIAKYNLFFNITTTVVKIIVLKITGNYILYLLIEMTIFLIQNIWNGRIVSKRYPYIKTKKTYNVDDITKKSLIKNVKAIFLHNIGTYCVFGTDNILISYFINIKAVGLYSNYTMVISQLAGLLTPVLNGIGASVGNLIATEGKEKNYSTFKIIYLINFWIYSLCVIFLYNLLEPFINWWLGEGLLLDNLTVTVVLLNFYITGLRSSVNIFKSKAGIFAPDKYLPLLEATINLVASIILVKYLGLAGIFIGTTISTITIPLWTQSKLVYNKIFEKSVLEYFKKYFYYAFLTIIVGAITTIVCNIFVDGSTFIHLVLKGMICMAIPNLIYLYLFYKTSEFKYLKNIFFDMLGNTNLGMKIVQKFKSID